MIYFLGLMLAVGCSAYAVWPLKTRRGVLELTSNIRIIDSSPPAQSNRPSDRKDPPYAASRNLDRFFHTVFVIGL